MSTEEKNYWQAGHNYKRHSEGKIGSGINFNRKSVGDETKGREPYRSLEARTRRSSRREYRNRFSTLSKTGRVWFSRPSFKQYLKLGVAA